MHPALLRPLGLVLALGAGAVLPVPASWQVAVRPLIVLMLLGVFLEVRPDLRALRWKHAWLFLANVGLGVGAWWVCRPLGPSIAAAAFFVGITPTAAAAAVVTRFLGGDLSFVVASFFVTNLGMALVLPWLMPLVLRGVPHAAGGEAAGVSSVALSLLLLVVVPLVVASVVRRFWPSVASWGSAIRRASFGVWLAMLVLITARVRDFIGGQTGLPSTILVEIALIAVVLCFLGFYLGRLIGGHTRALEAGQSLGQKNTTLTLYLALAHADPIAALGPAFYVIWHNLWNSWKLSRTPARR